MELLPSSSKPELSDTTRRGAKGPVPFANDPSRGPSLAISDDIIAPLSGHYHLSTALIDYLIQRAMPADLADNVLVGSATALSFFEAMNKKKPQSVDRNEAKTARALKREYQYYSFKPYQFVAANCSHNHFLVISVNFDAQQETEHIFQNVRVYDSIRRTGRRNETVTKKCIGAQFLRQFQLFLAEFSFFGLPSSDHLKNDPDYILRNAIYTSCPQQSNSHDCALFALATLLHLVSGEEITEETFSQEDITSFRVGLHTVLCHHPDKADSRFPDPKKFISDRFLHSFFPRLAKKTSDNDDDVYVQLLEKKRARTSDVDKTIAASILSESAESDEDYVDALEGVNDEHLTSANRTEDSVFRDMFIENHTYFAQLSELDMAIDRYEETSGYRIVIRKSKGVARIYKCASHIACCFRAKFGKQRGKETIVLKEANSVLYHCGSPVNRTAKGGRAYKKRLKGRLLSSIDMVHTVKEGAPVPKDVMKAAANLDGVTTSYNQSFRAIRLASLSRHEQVMQGFKLIIPYLEKFRQLNPESLTVTERDSSNHYERVFVCPGIMKTSMRYVRPVMSLDAAHLKSEWKGILYIASVKTGCNEIYPVAFAMITRDNENEEGWKWFLENLHSSIELLVMEHPNPSVKYKYFTFMSDRQKGLINALNEVFPQNHACYCSIHLQRNVERNFGKKIGMYVHPLSTNFSRRQSTEWLSIIGRISPQGLAYLEEIPENQEWRATSWLDNPNLPPRFGIVSTNMSESANAMFETARDVSWLQCIDNILAKMVERIAVMREKHKGKKGVVPHIAGLINHRWQSCAGYRVLELEENGNQFTVFRQSRGATQPSATYTIDVVNRICECGEWQDQGVPCVDAVAYYKLKAGLSLQYLLDNLVDKQYTFENELELLRKNIVPVCMETIGHDRTSLPPVPLTKRTSGRPKKVRLRKRTRWAHEPDKSTIVCSKCGMRGHNLRTCEARQNQESSSRPGADRSRNVRIPNPELDLS